MLTINDRRFSLVRASSGLDVTLGLEEYFGGQQHWRLVLYYVPADEDAGNRFGLPEQWCLAIDTISLKIADWREDLGRLRVGGDSENEFIPLIGSFSNIVERGYTVPASFAMNPHELRVIRRDGLLLTMELDGEIREPDPDDGDKQAKADAKELRVTGDFHLMDEVPLTGALVHVPVNVKDPAAYARKIAARDLKLDDFSDRTHVTPYNPESPWPRRIGRGTHMVSLTTRWRG